MISYSANIDHILFVYHFIHGDYFSDVASEEVPYRLLVCLPQAAANVIFKGHLITILTNPFELDE